VSRPHRCRSGPDPFPSRSRGSFARLLVSTRARRAERTADPRLSLPFSLAQAEWRGLGVQQSRGWVHYAIHRPEPHIMLYRCVSRGAVPRALFSNRRPAARARSRRRARRRSRRSTRVARGDLGDAAASAARRARRRRTHAVARDDGGV
jgi:hypothetical protein